MVQDIADKKSLTNRNVVLIVVFLLGLAISATHFVTYSLIAKPPLFTSREKSVLLNHVDKDHERDLEQQKIYLEQKAFNAMMLQSLKDQNKEAKQLSLRISSNTASIRDTQKDLRLHVNNRDSHIN